MTQQLQIEEELNSVITSFVIHTVFQHVGLFWIIDNNKHLKFEMDAQDSQCMDKGPWYNTTICTKLNDQSFEYYFKKYTMTGMSLCVLLMRIKRACINA